jgi:hypothetical protein
MLAPSYAYTLKSDTLDVNIARPIFWIRYVNRNHHFPR